MKRRIIVAIDGPGGAGKSTIARRLAGKLGFLYIDTGAMYRAVALWAQQSGTSWDNAPALEQLAIAADIGLRPHTSQVTLNGDDITEAIRTPEITQAASRISAIAGVRRAMVGKQRKMAEESSVVMEGRDIGTVVFPDADVKIYLDADPEVRADRRRKELEQKTPPAPPKDSILKELIERDQRDRTRAEAPLMQAPDALLVDTTGLGIEEVEEKILDIIRRKTSNGSTFH